MNWNNRQANPGEKSRMRDEIDAQIREFLQRGGKIDVLTANQRPPRDSAIGSVWHLEDFSEVDQ